MARAEWHVGDKPVITCMIERDGVAIDPTQLRLHVRKPGQATTTYVFDPADQGTPAKPITRLALGDFEAEIPLDVHGDWVFAYEADGNVEEYQEVIISVRRRRT